MHDITAPNIIMRWHIECQNPVVPQDWSLLYHPNIHYGQTFEMTLQIEADKPLPTRPVLSVYAVKGLPSSTGEWAMRRWDHAPYFAMLKPEYIIPFYVKDDKTDKAKRVLAPGSAYWSPGRKPEGWWEPLRTEDNKDNPPPELMMYEEYEFRLMGVENQEEADGDVESGKSATTNLFSSPAGDIGSGANGTEADYRNFTLCFPTIKFPGSYAFSIVFKNGISDIRYSDMYNLTEENYFTENVSVLLPGGPGYTHATGKADEYCLQYPDGTKFLNKKTGQEYCESGHSTEVTVTPEYKWQWQWVEVFEMLEGPFESVLRYVLPVEAPNDFPELDFVKPKYYLPAQAHPVFELSMYKGTPRKIAYSFNSTAGVDGYNPEFCYVDWPPDNLMEPCAYKSCPDQNVAYASFSPKLIWAIDNCENISEGTYNVQLGAWNPLDDWLWLDKSQLVEVLSRIGPIFIDDFNTINDKNESKPFNIRLGKMGIKTCITVDFGDGSKLKFFGNAVSCKMRYQTITDNDVVPVDTYLKNFDITHVYEVRGLYKVIVTGFDERSYAEESLDATIFRMPCKVPQVWLPVNETSWLRPERVPKNYR